MMSEQTSMVRDSLEEEGERVVNGVIKVNHSLLSQLTTSSPLDVYKPTNTYRANNGYTDELRRDHGDYQYVSSDVEDDLPPSDFLHDSLSFSTTANDTHHLGNGETDSLSTVGRYTSGPLQSHSPHMVKSKQPPNPEMLSVEKTVPPLALTDSLLCDDPDPSTANIVTDSLDFSMNDEDLQRIENLMTSKNSLPNPFHIQGGHTPNTQHELSISLALIQSATPRPVYSQSDYETSVMSSYADKELETPRVSVGDTRHLPQQNKYQEQQTSGQLLHQAVQLTPQQLNPWPSEQSGSMHNMQNQHLFGQQPTGNQKVMKHQLSSPKHAVSSQNTNNSAVSEPGRQTHLHQTSAQVTGPAFKMTPSNGLLSHPGQVLHPLTSSPPQSFRAQHYNLSDQYMAQQPPDQHMSYRQPPDQYMSQQPPDQHMHRQRPDQYMAQQPPAQHMSYRQPPDEYMAQQSPAQHMPYQQSRQLIQYSVEHPIGTQYTPQNTNDSSKIQGRSSSQSSETRSLSKYAFPSKDYVVTTQTGVVRTVAPKPERPAKDFIERNINRARGVSSAKTGYATRRLQSKQQQLDLKNWAPGMVVPRKKAASADMATRTTESSSPIIQNQPLFNTVPNPNSSVQSVWENNAAQLSHTKNISSSKPNLHAQRSDQSNITGRQSLPESRVKVDVNLNANSEVHTDFGGMRLIGPIAQQHFTGSKSSNFGYANGLYNGESDAGPPLCHPTSAVTSHGEVKDTTGVKTVHNNSLFYYGQQTSIQASHDAANDSYREQYKYLIDSNSSHAAVHSQSRWNPPQKPPNFVPDTSDFTIDDVIALEEEKLRRMSPQSSHSELNPYQTVPPITQQAQKQLLEGEAVAEESSYSRIHKIQKEKEDRAASYKKYTLKDYKQLNKEVKLGGLGPSADPDVLKEKRELRQKQLQIAKQARELEAKRASAKQKNSDAKRDLKPAPPSGRTLANEYAKTVPKPKVTPKKQVQTTSLPASSARSYMPQMDEVPNDSQITYRTNNVNLTQLNNFRPSMNLSTHGSTGQENITLTMSHSPTSPAPIQNQFIEDFGHFDTIDILHKRHLAEKRLVADLRQKI